VQNLVWNGKTLWEDGVLETFHYWPGASGDFYHLLSGSPSQSGDDGFAVFGSAEVVGDADVSGFPCIELLHRGEGGEYARLWVGKDSLVRRYSRLTVIAEMDRRVAKYRPRDAAGNPEPGSFSATLTIETFEPVIDTPIPSERFAPRRVERTAIGLGARLGVGEDPNGVLIIEVFANSPAANSGLQPRDIIHAINGVRVAVHRDVANAVAGLAKGTDVKLDIVRDGKIIEVRVVIDQYNLP
jgi:hypothetical protein